MNGLECSEIMYSYIIKASDIFRIDSFYYKKEFLIEESIIDKILNTSIYELPNAEILSFGAYSLNNYVEYLDDGIPFIRCVNMKNGIINNTDILYISEKANRLLHKSAIYPETVLLSMSGSIGNVALALPEWKYPINSNQDIAKIHLNGDLNPYYLYSFLRSKFGKNYMLREARGSVQQHVFLSQIEKFKIPIVSSIFAECVEMICKEAFALLNTANEKYSFSEQILLKSLNMYNFIPSQQNTTTKSLSQFMNAGRLDAEYFQPKYDDIENKIELLLNDKKNGCFTVNNIISESNRVIKIEDKKEYKYIELSDIDNYGNVTDCTIDIGINLPSRARKEVYTGDVIVSSLEGSLQKCAIITETFNGALVSTGFHVVKSDEINSETLLLLFKSWFMQELMRKHSTGAIMAATSDDSFKKILLPVVKLDVQEMIANKIQKSFELRAKSNELLEAAKRAVEIAIEEDEETAMQYLEQFECVGKEV